MTQPNPMRVRALTLAKCGLSLRNIAAVCGVSHEWVRVWLLADGMGPKELAAAKWRQKETKAEQRALERLERAKNRPPCTVCGALVVGPGKRVLTCSPECAEAWLWLRYHTPEGREKQRDTHARSILRHAETRPAVEVAWAKRRLSGQSESRPERYHYQPGSNADKAARKFGWGKIYDK